MCEQMQIEGLEGTTESNEFSRSAMERAVALLLDFAWLVKRHPIVRTSAAQIAQDAINENGRCGSRWLGEQVRRGLVDSDGTSFENGIVPLVARCVMYDVPALNGRIVTHRCALDAALGDFGGFGRILA